MEEYIVEIPYGKRDKYVDFIYEVNNLIPIDGMLMVAVNNIVYDLSIRLCIIAPTETLIKIKKMATKNCLQEDKNSSYDKILEESFRDRKWDTSTFMYKETKERISSILNMMCLYYPESVLEKRGYKNLISYKKIFISYSYKDKDIVYDFENRCQKLGFPVWIDKNDIEYGDDINAKINEGLRDSQLFLAFVSKNTLQSRYAKEELSTLYRKLIYNGDRVIIIKLDDVDLGEIFIGLANKRYLDYTDESKVEEFLNYQLEELLKNH
ncbi:MULTISPECIES: toll/interleukin-1 receptor domain-containing protein [Terrabacteria group]|uniref:toll/interleukin-1 receptor domain-containing protein n=1 Tax=Bacillati TaxID=1783272 RepID=UPI001C6E844F|nr:MULTISPECIES: toll/interleukin-1 receptor domain-containing protein [Terrabacteria group]MBW9212958.1 toll/interleukin-1 receptor domain-containing protein [Trueperella sp. zg.1013]